MDEKKAYPAGHPIYERLRNLATVATGIFSVGPLIGPYSDEDAALCVNASVESAIGHTVEMRLWRPSIASPLRLEVRTLGLEGGDHGFYDLREGPPTYGLEMPPSEDRQAVLAGIPPLSAIHRIANEAHHGLEGKGVEEDISLVRLNGALQEGAMAAELLPDEDEDFDDDEDALGELEDMVLAAAEDSDIENLTFNGYHQGDLGLSTTATVTVAANPVVLQVWTQAVEGGSDSELKASVAGAEAELTEDGFVPQEGSWPGDEVDQERISGALDSVADVHLAALEAFAQILDEARVDAVGELRTVAMEALQFAAIQRHRAQAPGGGLSAAPPLPGQMGDDMDDDGDWHEAAEAFTEACRLPIFAGVTIQEGPDGGIDIAATTVDPVGLGGVPVKVYWHRPGPGTDPEHWYAVGEATGPAHDGGQALEELLAGYHPDSRAHFEHVLDHLHQMAHDASEVLEGRVGEMRAAMARSPKPMPALAQEHVVSHIVSDVIEGLNGIARLYSGSFPDWSGYPND